MTIFACDECKEDKKPTCLLLMDDQAEYPTHCPYNKEDTGLDPIWIQPGGLDWEMRYKA